MSVEREVVITGSGAVSALGHDVARNWDAIIGGRSGIAVHTFHPGTHGPPPFSAPAALVPDGYAAACEKTLGRRIVGGLDRFALFALGPAAEALAQARLLDHAALRHRTAIVLGHGQGGMGTMDVSYERFFGTQSSRLHPYTIPRGMLSAGVSALSMQFGIQGPAFATSSACASSAHAMLQGATLLRAGIADVAIVGGSDAMCTPAGITAWQSIGALSRTTCRPFSAGRDGMVLGEGGGILVLETREHAEARGAAVLGRFLAGASNSDAGHLTQPGQEGPRAVIREVAAAAGLLDQTEVLIAAHGTGTPMNDQNEAAALQAVFGPAVRQHPVIATKSAHAHVLGGSFALQAAITLQALLQRSAPAIQNYLERDDACDLDLVIDRPRSIRARCALLNAFAFGGLNVAMAIGL